MLEPFGDLQRRGAMMGAARMERAKAADRHIGIVRRYRPAGLVARGREQLGGVPLGRGEAHEHVRMAEDLFGARLDAHIDDRLEGLEHTASAPWLSDSGQPTTLAPHSERR